MMPRPIAESLRRWAGNQLPVQAAVELLLRCFDGQLITPDRPWLAQDLRGDWIDFIRMTPPPDDLSPQQRNVWTIAASLAAGAPIDLGRALAGLDRDTVGVVLAAVAHTGRDPWDANEERRQDSIHWAHAPGMPAATNRPADLPPIPPSLFQWPSPEQLSTRIVRCAPAISPRATPCGAPW